MAPRDPSRSLVLDVPPPAPAAPSPMPSPVALVPSPVPSTAPVPAQTTSSILFDLGDILSKSKVAALFQLKCDIFDSSFLPKDDVIKEMATKCLNAAVCHSGMSQTYLGHGPSVAN